MHRQRARDERRDEQYVVAENHIARDRIERRQQEALEQEVIGVGQRARGGIKMFASNTAPVKTDAGFDRIACIPTRESRD